MQTTIEFNIKDFEKWSNVIQFSYYSFLRDIFSEKSRFHLYNPKLRQYESHLCPKNLFVEMCYQGELPIYNLPPNSDKLQYAYIKNGKWFNKEIEKGKTYFLVPFSSYNFSNECFITNIRKVIAKFGEDPEFYAIISFHDVWANFDEVYGGMGFFYSKGK